MFLFLAHLFCVFLCSLGMFLIQYFRRFGAVIGAVFSCSLMLIFGGLVLLSSAVFCAVWCSLMEFLVQFGAERFWCSLTQFSAVFGAVFCAIWC